MTGFDLNQFRIINCRPTPVEVKRVGVVISERFLPYPVDWTADLINQRRTGPGKVRTGVVIAHVLSTQDMLESPKLAIADTNQTGAAVAQCSVLPFITEKVQLSANLESAIHVVKLSQAAPCHIMNEIKHFVKSSRAIATGEKEVSLTRGALAGYLNSLQNNTPKGVMR